MYVCFISFRLVNIFFLHQNIFYLVTATVKKIHFRIVNNRFSFQNYFPTRHDLCLVFLRRFAEVGVAEQMNSAASIYLKHARTSLQFLYLHLQTKSFPSHKFILPEVTRVNLKNTVVQIIKSTARRFVTT